MLYITIVTIVLALLTWFMPKKIKTKDILVAWITVSFSEIVVDLILAYFMELYYFAGEERISGSALLTKLIMAPLFGIIFLNFMPRDFKRFIPYFIGWVILSTLFEWTTTISGYLTYTGWKLWYSFLFYIVAIPIFRWYYYYVKH